MNRLSSHLLSILLIAAPLAAQAQYNDNPDAPEMSGTARLSVRVSQMEEQIRRLQGTIEQVSYENKQLKAQLDKALGDYQYRLQKLEGTGAPAAAGATNNGADGNNGSINTTGATTGGDLQSSPPQTNYVRDHTVTAPPPAAHFANPRDHYNQAFRLMQQAQYAQAGSSFAAFVRQYPHDPLIGNAHYWLGETYYVRRDYLQAADNFRQGYEAMPSGPKAADNLLKLAMSLDALKKDREACVVLKQVKTKYGKSSSSIRQRADQELNRIGCD